ncbi:MAG: sigma-70 family RNA polymerase sigma factor [Limisphaerales bacterium]
MPFVFNLINLKAGFYLTQTYSAAPDTGSRIGMTQMHNNRENDEELVRRAKAGDLDAFEKLVQKYESKIYLIALRILQNPHDAQDVTQQTFLSVIENLKNFRGDSSFATWITKIATYAALKIIRKRNGLDTVSLEQTTEPNKDDGEIPHPEYIADWKESPSDIVNRNETRRLIEQALSELEEPYRLTFILRDVEGLSIKETAEVLGISEANVKVKLLRARLQLREKLTRLFANPQKVFPKHDHHS